MDVEVDPEQDQRPQHGCEQRRPDLLEGVEIRPVVMGGRDDRPDDQIHEEDDADSRPRSRRCWCVVGHASSVTSFRSIPAYPLPGSENDATANRLTEPPESEARPLRAGA